MFKFMYTVIIILITSVNVYCSNTKCIRKSPCLCVKNDNSKLDISSVLGNNSYLEDTLGDITYYFFGCKDNKEVPRLNCTGLPSSLIKYNKTDGNCTSIGKANSIQFEFANNKQNDYLLVYNESGNVLADYPTIRLICVDFDTPFIKIISNNTDELALASPNACLIEAKISPSLSDGSIFLLILFITAGVYFFGGALLLYSIRGARGIEVIPNLDFWKNLPGLVKDGAIFVLSGCKPTFVSTAETYDRI